MKIIWLLGYLAFGLLSIPVAAHHGWAAFDSEEQVTLQGTVTELYFANPHSVVEFAVKSSKRGKAE